MFVTFVVLAVFSLVVIVHELGHFLVCKAVGVRVEKFAVGFGKEIFGFHWKNTRWSFCILPLGGYVKPAGEDFEESTKAPDEFFGQSWYRRIAIAVAGPIMNYALALICFFALMFFWGQPQPSIEATIGEVVSGYPAQAAGLQKGDRIAAINGVLIKTWEEASEKIHASAGIPIDMRIVREEGGIKSEQIIAIVPKEDEQRNIGLIGISPVVEYQPLGFSAAWISAGQQTVFWTTLTLDYLKNAIVKRKKPKIAGPIGIAAIVAKVARQGLQEMIGLIALISLSLGLFNLFPIPLLDGGHIILYLIEGISRRPLNRKMVQVSNVIGATFLFSVLILATTQDLLRLKDSFFK